MYWFSGIVGGTFYYLFPGSGILGFRILGVMVQTLTILISHNFLKKFIPGRVVKISLFILTMFISNDPKELYYNNLSALFFVASAISLVSGLHNDKKRLIILSGIFLSLNTFTRVSSISGLAFLCIVFCDGYLRKLTFKGQLVNGLSFIAGFAFFTLIILVIMNSIGHLEIFLSTMNVVFGMGNNLSDSHSFFRLIKLFIMDYSNSFIYASVFYIIVISAILIYKMIRKARKYFLLIYLFIGLIFFAFVSYLFYKYFFQWINLMRIITGTSLFITFLIVQYSRKNEIKLIAVTGSLMLLIAPLGSAGGLYSMGRYSLWLIFPVTIYYINRITDSDFKFNISNKYSPIVFVVPKLSLHFLKNICISVIIIMSLYYAYFYPYFDLNNRKDMHYSVNNRYLRGVYTSESRAEAIQQLLEESTKYVKKSDYVFAYDCIPLFHYLTETRPFLYNSWPWTFYPEIFKDVINKSVKDIPYLPVVILQKVNTLGTNWPDNPIYTKTENEKERGIVFTNFLNKYGYKKVWGNVAFDILLPGKSRTVVYTNQ
jgi:hypothetical protein